MESIQTKNIRRNYGNRKQVVGHLGEFIKYYSAFFFLFMHKENHDLVNNAKHNQMQFNFQCKFNVDNVK